MRSDASQLATLHDQVLIANWTAFEVTFQNFTGTGRITGLRRQAGTRNVRRHAMIWHGAPRMVLRCGLWEPDIARITGQLTTFQRANHSIAVSQFAASGVD